MTYCAQARGRVDTGTMVNLFDMTRKAMGATPLFVRVLAEATQYFMSTAMCVDLLSNPLMSTRNLDCFLESKVDKTSL